MDKTEIEGTINKKVSMSKIQKISRGFDISSKSADELLELANSYIESGNTEKALHYYESAYEGFKTEKDIIGEGYALTGIGFIHEKDRKYTDARKCYQHALKKFKEAKDKKRSKIVSKLLADLILTIADEEVKLEKFNNAEESYRESFKYYKDSKDIIGEGYALTGLGVIFGKYEEYEESREYYGKALKKFKMANDFKRAGIVLEFIANSYELQEALDDALINYERSLQLFKDLKDLRKETEINRNILLLQKKKSKYKAPKKQVFFLSAYLVLICLAEIITTFYNIKAGLIIHVSILSIILVHSSFEKSYTFSNLLMSMMAIPIIRIIGLTVPLMQTRSLFWFPIISIPLFASAFTIINVQKIDRIKLGLTFGNIPVQLAIALSGIIIGFIEYQILHPEPLISTFNIVSVIIAGLLLLLSTGFAEELLFRGIIQKNAETIVGAAFAILYTSLLFTSMHIGWKSLFDLILVFGVSMFYGYMFHRTKSLFGVTLSHGISNSVLFLIMPFVVF